ncbi:hypothetical protein [Leucobacter luti]|uniref:Peptidoglycan binding protein n=1 Tax=Leucobacter luti TaxID=340320 RepID=A0A4Q7TTA4_9MICO|nr:hypothetical protein [Leucobacter luti]MBL3699750.1 hypothetical protein [Leucobacter luti]RZT62928.1 hypothetical protein EV139_2637 [Leucobacter luti]
MGKKLRDSAADTEPEGLEPEGDAGGETASAPGAERLQWRDKRLVVLVAAVAVVFLLLGIGVMQFIVSPAELAARTAPPEAGVVTAKIEERVIENTVVTRADVGYAGAVKVKIESGAETAIVTGRVPKVSSVLNAQDLALEVSGRPVIVLPGDLPAYRDLAVGSIGPDVVQLHTALASLGYAVDNTDTFTATTAQALQALYTNLGYPAPGSDAPVGDRDEGGDGSARAAERALQEANDALAAAHAAYAAGSQPRSGSAVIEAQNAVASAQRALDTAVKAQAPANEIADLEGDVALAQAVLAEAQAPEDLGTLAAEVSSAESAVAAAQDDLAVANEAALPGLPASEAMFLPNLPRRVDEVNVERGKSLSDPAMVVSGNTLTLTGSLTKQAAPMIEEGMEATFSVTGGEELTATVRSVSKAKTQKSSDESDERDESGESTDAPSGPYLVQLRPEKLTSAQTQALRDSNVRVRFEIESTGGEVLAVPIAAITAGPDGSSRIEIAPSQNADPDSTEMIEVELGLSAQGFVEVISDDPLVEPGAHVVIGR